MDLLKTLDIVAAETGKPIPQIAINWSAQKSYVTTAICGVRNAEEAQQNCATFDWSLTDAQMKLIDDKLLELDI